MSFLEKLQKGMQGEQNETTPEENGETAGIQNAEENRMQETAAVFTSYKSADAPAETEDPAPAKKTRPRGRPRKLAEPAARQEPANATENSMPEIPAAKTQDYYQKDPQKTMANKKLAAIGDNAENQWLDGEGQLAVNVYQTENDLVLQSAIAGIKVEDLDVLIEDDVITIKGNRANPLEETGDYFIEECYWGPFSRKIILPVEVDSSRADAAMKDGILTIRIPKIQREKKKKLTIKE